MKRFLLIVLLVAVVLSLISTPAFAAKGGNGQGNNPATGHAPDQDGKGADKGEQDNDGRGPVDVTPDADADRNNGSGNDEDCEDDNNGNGPKCQPPVTVTPSLQISTPVDTSIATPAVVATPPVTVKSLSTGKLCCDPKTSICEVFTVDDWTQYSKNKDEAWLESRLVVEDDKPFCQDVPVGRYVVLFWTEGKGHSGPTVPATIRAGNTQHVRYPSSTSSRASLPVEWR